MAHLLFSPKSLASNLRFFLSKAAVFTVAAAAFAAATAAPMKAAAEGMRATAGDKPTWTGRTRERSMRGRLEGN